MSSCYEFYDITGKYVFGKEEYSLNHAKIFCRVMGLPKIPFNFGSYNEGLWNVPGGKQSVTLPVNPEKIHSKVYTSYEGLKQSAHWKLWGLEKLNNISLSDVQGKFRKDYRHCYEALEAFTEIKEDILLFLDAYTSATYYRMSF